MSARRRIDRLNGPTMALAAIFALMVPVSASADDAQPPSTGFWNGVLKKLDLKTSTDPMPDFVRATHPDPSKMTFIPTGPVPRNQPIPLKSSDEIDAAKAALDAAQAAQLAPPAVTPPAPAPAPPTVAAPRRKARTAKSAEAKSKPAPQTD